MEKYFNLSGENFNIRCKIYFSPSGQVLPEDSSELSLSDLSFRHIIVFCHGFAGDKDNRAAHLLSDKILAQHSDTALLIFNWPAHGDDEHTCIALYDCDRYLTEVLRFVEEAFHPQILDGCATSFGGYLVLKYLADHGRNPFRRICLRCPAVVMYHVLTDVIFTPEDKKIISEGGHVPAGFDRIFEITPSFLEELKRADIRTNDLRQYADCIKIVQGMRDELVPYLEVKGFADKNGISCLLVEDADHRFLEPPRLDIVLDTFAEFLGF